jgi:hypothetical protein
MVLFFIGSYILTSFTLPSLLSTMLSFLLPCSISLFQALASTPASISQFTYLGLLFIFELHFSFLFLIICLLSNSSSILGYSILKLLLEMIKAIVLLKCTSLLLLLLLSFITSIEMLNKILLLAHIWPC